MKIKILGVLTVILALSLTACPEPNPDPTPTHTHQWGNWTTTTPATCSVTGTQTRTCILDATHIDTQDIPIDPTAHDWGNWEVTTPATTTADGEETRTCKHDATHKETQPIAKLDPTCPCPPNTVHPFGTTCPEACIGVGHEGCNCTIGNEPAVTHPPQQITFGTALSTTVTGPAMTDTQWNTVITNLTAALNAAANDGDDLGTNTAGLFALGISIDLVENAAYQYYSADLAGRKISLNSGYVIVATVADLSAKVAAAIHGAVGNGPAQAKAPANDNGWEQMNREAITINNLSLLCV